MELRAGGSVTNYYICAGGQLVDLRTSVIAEAIYHLLSIYYVLDINYGKGYEQYLSFFQSFGLEFDAGAVKGLNLKKFENKFKPVFGSIQST